MTGRPTRSLRRGAALLAAGLAAVGLTAAAPAASAAPAAAPAAPTATAADDGGRCANGYVGLTFDDGPSATTDQLLAALTSNHLRATMFDQGNNSQANPDLVRAERRAGMWIGNHTLHPPAPDPAGRARHDRGDHQHPAGPARPHRPQPKLFRPPFGETNDQAARTRTASASWRCWDVDSQDWNGASVDQIAAAAHTLRPGGIILMHDWPPNTIQAIPLIARDLAARGLCPGRIAYTPQDIPFGSQVFHAVAVRP